MKIDSLYDSNCTSCPRSKGRHKPFKDSKRGKAVEVCFPGSGNLEGAKLLIVMDTPSREEDLASPPPCSFSDSRAQILISALKDVGIHLGENGVVYGTYACKCYSPDRMSMEHARVCVDRYLKQEIALLKPSIVVLMGKTCQQAVLGMVQPVSKTHGKVFPIEGTDARAVVVEHPFAILSNPTKYKAWVGDFARVRGLLKGKDPYFSPEKLDRYTFKVVNTPELLEEMVVDLLSGSLSLIGVDTETSGYDSEVFSPDYKLFSVQLGLISQDSEDLNEQLPVYYIPVQSSYHEICTDLKWKPRVIDALNRVLGVSSPLWPVAHNAKFDQKVLWSVGVSMFTGWDTLSLRANTHGEAPLSLKEIAYQITDLGGYEKPMEEYFEKHQTFDAAEELAVSYGCLDIIVLRALMYELCNSILKECERKKDDEAG